MIFLVIKLSDLFFKVAETRLETKGGRLYIYILASGINKDLFLSENKELGAPPFLVSGLLGA